MQVQQFIGHKLIALYKKTCTIRKAEVLNDIIISLRTIYKIYSSLSKTIALFSTNEVLFHILMYHVLNNQETDEYDTAALWFPHRP